ncbi:MAG: PAS domain-containing protein [Kordiimonadaceae bacterium]|nr:PAS domain-containing protein [Kordiimonadaceae bacterium]
MPFWPRTFPASDIIAGVTHLYFDDEIYGHNAVANYFYTFWCSLTAEGHKPCRADFRPSRFKEFLDRVVMLDVGEMEGHLRLHVRLVGTHVSAFYGEIAGGDIDAMENTEAVNRIYESCSQVIESEKPVLRITTGIAQDKIHLVGHTLYMPLFDNKGAVVKLLVCVDVTTTS